MLRDRREARLHVSAAGADHRRETIGAPVPGRATQAAFDDSGGEPGTYGSPRVFEDLIEAGWAVSEKTVAASMVRQSLWGRPPKRKRRSLTRPDKAAAPIPDLVKRDFSAEAPDLL